ncbi:hypothetical protein [Anaeromyxobacter terrae]|uniref:hypothetical protein n=1 Tax=Anaeromyxobacter terrae TaxID=2925406 RepID=UPI001F5659B7|nr:hypothetical protein [Anaeromyxobacter sp. SG22]
MKLGRPGEALEAFESRGEGPGGDALLDYYHALACYGARLYARADRLLASVEARAGPPLREQATRLRGELAAVLAGEPPRDAIAWYLARCEEQARRGRASSARAYCEEARALGERRADRYGVATAAPEGPFERGLRLMRAGDRRAAVAAFAEARGDGDEAAALLEGICLYELGEDARADEALALAERTAEHREAAEFYRGLVARRAGRADDAARLLERASTDPELGATALGLARLARRGGRLGLSIFAESGWDSNVDLAPDASRAGSGTSDGDTGITAVGRWSPLGESGPFLRATAQLRDQVRYDALDLRGGGAAAGWQAGRGARYLLAEVGYDRQDLGGAPYLSAPRALGAARVPLSAEATLGATYLARWESFHTEVSAPYGGLRQLGEVDLTVLLGGRGTATLAWRGVRDGAIDPALASFEQGPRAGLRLELGPRARAGLDASCSWRTYDALDPGLRAVRADTALALGATLELDLADRWSLRLGVAGRKEISNVPELTWTKIAPSLGIAYTVGLR